jgi:hypothetical protein
MASARHRRRLRASAAAVLLLASVAAAGCTTIGRRYGEPVAPQLANLREGATTVSEAIAGLGPPARLSPVPGGLAMLYEYVDGTENQLGINLELVGLDWFKVAIGRGSAEREELLLLFDEDAVLRSREYRAWQEKTGNGFGFQLFFVAMPTVDSKHLWESPEQFTWGRRALEPLTVTLNEGNSVTSGTHGIEVRGTPDSAGQRTLESQRKRRRR